MQSRWKRCGRIIGPELIPGNYRLVQCPTAWPLDNGLLRIAFSARDSKNRGQLLAVDVDATRDMRIVSEHFRPLVALQDCPPFAKDGLAPGHALFAGEVLHLYGTSLNLDAQPYDMSIVLLTSNDQGLTFSQPQQVLTSSANHGLPVALPAVGGIRGRYHLWYTAFQQWILDAQPHPDSKYVIRHATSDDGVAWIPEPGDAVRLRSSDESGLARPTVCDGEHGLEMWFSSRGPFSAENPTSRYYRLGYATSTEGSAWQRCDEEHVFVNPPQASDWDATMQCYPSVFKAADGQMFMFYCGNWYGAGGFGYAIRLP